MQLNPSDCDKELQRVYYMVLDSWHFPGKTRRGKKVAKVVQCHLTGTSRFQSMNTLHLVSLSIHQTTGFKTRWN